MSKAAPQPTTDPKKRNRPSLPPTSTPSSSSQTPATPKKSVAEQSQNAPPASGSSEAAVKRALYKQRKRKILQKIDNELNNALNAAKYISDSSDDDTGSAREMMAPFGLIPVSDDDEDEDMSSTSGLTRTNGHAPASKDKTKEKEDKEDESAFWLGEKRHTMPFPCKLAASLDVKRLLSGIRSLALDKSSQLLSSKVFSEDEINHLQSLLPEDDSKSEALQYALSEAPSLGPVGSFLEDLSQGKFDHARQLEIKQNRHKQRGEILLFQSNYTDKMIKTILDYKTRTGSPDMYCYLLLDQQFCSPTANNQRHRESDSDTSSVSSTSSEDSSFSEAETDDFFSMPEPTSISPLSEDHFASISLPAPIPTHKPAVPPPSSIPKPKPAPVVQESEPEAPKVIRQEVALPRPHLPPPPSIVTPVQVPSTITVSAPVTTTVPNVVASAPAVVNDKDLNSTPRSKKRPRRKTPPIEDPKARKKMKLDGSPSKESSGANGDEEGTGGEYADPDLETDPSVEPAPPVWAFLSSIRDIFLLCHREANTPYIVSEIEKNEEKNKFVMPSFTVQQFVLMALNFLAEPPSLSSSPNGELRDNYNLYEALNRPPRGTDDEPMTINHHTITSNPDSGDHSSVSSPSQSSSSSSSSHIDIVQNIALHQALQHQPSTPSSSISPFVQYDKEKDLWTWIGKVEEEQTKDQLDTLELLFYYCASRGYTQDDNTRIKFSLMKHQKCTPTVPATSPENVERFRAQEAFRYKEQPYVPFYYDFNNTLTMIAPLKRNTIGISSQKAREHFLLKADRPPHVSLLSLVRDAAAKLPGGVGTRPDVAILLRDSQFVVQEVPDNKLNAVVSGALDRLHADEDPCVRYDSDQKLWIYLHRRRTPASFAPQTVRPKRRAAPRKPQPPAPQ